LNSRQRSVEYSHLYIFHPETSFCAFCDIGLRRIHNCWDQLHAGELSLQNRNTILTPFIENCSVTQLKAILLCRNTSVCRHVECRKLGTSKRFSEAEKSKVSELLASKLEELQGQQRNELEAMKTTFNTRTRENREMQALTDAMYTEMTHFVKSKLETVLRFQSADKILCRINAVLRNSNLYFLPNLVEF
jgi:hypothetical protein